MTQTTQSENMETDKIKSTEAIDDPITTHKPSRRKKIIRFLVVSLIILALASGVPYLLHFLSHESTDDAFIDGNIVAISPRVTGYIIRVYVKDNEQIRAGDRLVDLDPRDFEAHLNAAKAALKSAKAAYGARNIAVELTTTTATAGLNEAKDNVEAVKARVQEAKARFDLSKATLDQVKAETVAARARHRLDVTDLKRYREMAKTRTVSPQDLDHARAAEQISAAALTAAKKKIVTQRARIRETAAALKAAEAELRQANARLIAARSAPQRIRQSRSMAEVTGADIEKARAEVVQASLNFSYTKIYAPCDGFVTKKEVQPGQLVQRGQSLLAIVPRSVWVTANFKETQLTHMRPGQPVDITVDAYPDLILHGHVDSIQHGTGASFSLLPAENATGNYIKVVQRVPVKIIFNQSKEAIHVLLAPGMSVTPDVDIDAEGWPDSTPKESTGNKVSIFAKNGAALTE